MNPFVSIYDYFRLVIHRKMYSQKQIKRYQFKQLQKIVTYAKENSPFYQNLYNGISLNTFDDFYKLPTINKRIMMENFSTLNTCGLDRDEIMAYAIEKEINKDFLGYYLDQYVVGLSSGTSGNKGIYVTPKSMTTRLPAVFLARGGFPMKLLPFKILFMLRVFSQGFDDINSKLVSLHYLSTMEPIMKVIDTINELRINILMAPPSFIRELLPYHENINVRIKRIMTYAEVLSVEDKLQFEKIFQTKVIEIYQASEGQIASACSHGFLHINEDLVHIEILDEDGNRIHETHKEGHRMILTNLINYTQPLIRYEMNDMIVLDEQCPCGSHFRRIEKVLGRHDDLLYFYNSIHEKIVVYPDLFVRWIIVISDLIREFQVVQEEINTLTITLDLLTPSYGDLEKDLIEKITTELYAFDILKPQVFIRFDTIKIPKDKNKYQRFINRI